MSIYQMLSYQPKNKELLNFDMNDFRMFAFHLATSFYVYQSLSRF